MAIDFRLVARSKYGWRIYAALVLYFLLAAYIHIHSFLSPYIGVVLQPLPDGSWLIEEVDEGGLAADWRLQPGDRIRALDPKAELTSEGEAYRLRKADSLSVAKPDGRLADLRPVFSRSSGTALSLAMEAALLGLAIYALRKQPESVVIRSFFNLNYILALVILSIYSPGGSLSLLLLTFCSIWLPYLLLSFYLQFLFRTSVLRFKKLKRVYLVGTIAFTIIIASLILAEVEVSKWISDVLNMALLGTVLLLAGITGRSWGIIDRIERSQLRLLFAGLILSLLPYTFLYAIPILLHEPFILPMKVALIAVVPLSLFFTYILVKRSLLDMRLSFPRLTVHVLYGIAVFILFVLSARVRPLPLYLPFIGFLAITLLYRRGLLRYPSKTDLHGEKLERQRRALFAVLEDKRNARKLLALLAEGVSKRLGDRDVCLIWQDGPAALIHGTGKYKPIGQELRESGIMAPREGKKWASSHGFDRLLELKNPSDGRETFGYIGIGTGASELSEADRQGLSEIAELIVVHMMSIGGTCDYRERRIDRSLLEAQEAERVRTSYFLHDRLLQNLIFISRDLEELIDTGKPDKERVALWLKCIYESQSDIRSLCDDLHPPILDHGDLKPAIEWLIRSEKQRAKVGIEAELVYELGQGEPRNELIRANLFRAVRELVNNAYKHSGATRLTIRLWNDERYLYCGVRDNGCGFDVSSVLEPLPTGGKRFGIQSLHSQIRQLGGETDIDSLPGQGTSVQLMLPLETEERAYAVPN
ncbi:sensor histidine kinase [Cohnella sp. AR92]|uniref:sensor histidine kinase n=1 Tax=Cohnella sp. AR92 TaxID=648716 RepID=UPI000F8F614B|nr:ATP-binding protein [Cohnella sp. AR92]RUS48379.1 hypothetical protein ELR57_02870 [Cohnella sp. AR92]